MQTTTDTTGKQHVLKLLAVGGFIALIIIIAWLGVQIVRVAPKAITSLASIADVVYNYEDIKVDVASNKAVANADESQQPGGSRALAVRLRSALRARL